jgi:predicted nucleotidyltransferase
MIPQYPDMDRIDSISAELAQRFAVLYDKIVALEIENKRLTAERDEARQMFCNAMTDHCEEDEARQIAKEQGWDCFKEDGK